MLYSFLHISLTIRISTLLRLSRFSPIFIIIVTSTSLRNSTLLRTSHSCAIKHYCDLLTLAKFNIIANFTLFSEFKQYRSLHKSSSGLRTDQHCLELYAVEIVSIQTRWQQHLLKSFFLEGELILFQCVEVKMKTTCTFKKIYTTWIHLDKNYWNKVRSSRFDCRSSLV